MERKINFERGYDYTSSTWNTTYCEEHWHEWTALLEETGFLSKLEVQNEWVSQVWASEDQISPEIVVGVSILRKSLYKLI